MPRETAGAGIKFPTIPRDGNLIGENPAVAVGRIASRPAGDKTCIATLRYITSLVLNFGPDIIAFVCWQLF